MWDGLLHPGVDLQSDKEKEATLGKTEHMAPRLSGSSLGKKLMTVKGVPSYPCREIHREDAMWMGSLQPSLCFHVSLRA